MKFQFKVVCEQRWNPFMQRFEERCETQVISVAWGAWVPGHIGVIVLVVALFVGSVMLSAAFICLRCKVRFTSQDMVLLIISVC